MKKFPDILVGKNISLDKDIILELAEIDKNFMKNSFSDYSNGQIINDYISQKYIGEEKTINNNIKFLNRNLDLLKRVCSVLSDITNEGWEGIDLIKIYIGLCPVNPRFLKQNEFLLSYDLSTDILLHFSVHELTHFIYFKGWQRLFPDDSFATFESPHPNWILSEILAPVIMRDERIFKLIGTRSGMYQDWVKIDKELNFFNIFLEIYNNSDNFSDFLIKSKKTYLALDQRINLSSRLLFC